MMVQITKNKKHLTLGIIIFILYFLLYYWSINYLNITDGPSQLVWSSNWRSFLLRQTAPFIFEPIGLIQFSSIQILISPMNIVIGLILGTLVFINILSSLYIYQLPKQCRLDYKYSGFIGILPSFLTGFICCAPGFIIPLSSILGSSTVFFTRVFRWFLPLSLLLLLYGIFRSSKIIRTFNV